jgi:hypothetical protein
MTRPTPAAPEQTGRDEAEASLRRLSGEVTVLENFDRRLTHQMTSAQEAGRDDYVRELHQRRISVRSRLQEMQLRRERAREDLDRLG